MSYLECQQANTFWKGEKNGWKARCVPTKSSHVVRSQVSSGSVESHPTPSGGLFPDAGETWRKALVPQQRTPRCYLDFGVLHVQFLFPLLSTAGCSLTASAVESL